MTARICLAGDAARFENRRLVLSLYGYGPRLTDTPASLLDQKTLNVDYTGQEKGWPFEATMGNSDLKPDKKCTVVTVVQDKDGARTHDGYKNGTDGFSMVPEDSHEKAIALRPRD